MESFSFFKQRPGAVLLPPDLIAAANVDSLLGVLPFEARKQPGEYLTNRSRNS